MTQNNYAFRAVSRLKCFHIDQKLYSKGKQALITIVVFVSSKKSVSWMIAASALAACSLLVAVIASWRLIILLHPELPIAVEPFIIKILWSGMLLGYSLGFLSLLACIGLSGWLRSKRSGLITSGTALVAVVFFVLATPFGAN
ncbi:hypothetical protein [Marisediminitalea sp.]|uniref:hypothetical protein n=1 Tax=Marisediminitalea sp. TaxID=2662268 RepID=UPI00336C5F82|nr:hypothetical protein [Aestuariibacter sp.]MCP4949653.1 hypothetical protein [Aestuariibacter sp.]MCP5011549.1 hypothetical protein [Aestuariibacter sp.]